MKKRQVLVIIISIIAVGLGFGVYSYNKGPRDLRQEKADLSLTANELLAAFQTDESKANETYLDKVVVVVGTVSAIDRSQVNSVTLETVDLMSGIVCEMAGPESVDGLQNGQDVRIKGQCTGFLSDVILVKCIIEE